MRIRTSRLPAGYREVEYLQSNGSQIIKTGITASNELGLHYKIYDTSGRFGVLGANDNLRHHSYDSSALYGYATRGWESMTLNTVTEAKINYFNDHSIYKNGTFLRSDLPTTAWDTEMEYYLFARNFRTDGTASPYWSGRIYFFKMTVGNELVRDFIPCVRISDSKPGLYDVVNKYFYINQGTGADFSVGSYVDVGYRVSTTLLPEAYQEVEYITFSGTSGAGQFIRTGINTLTHPYSVKTIYNKTNTDNRDQTLVGQRQIGKYVNIYNTYYETVFANTASGTAPNNEKTMIEIKSGTGVIKNGEAIYSTTNTSERTTQYELLIGAFSEDSYENAKWFFNGNIYDIQIINNGKLYRHYIPCYRKSDNVIGMYDVVGHTFYTNDGSGSFTKGSDAHSVMKTTPKINLLPSEYQGVEYIESTGTQWIDTGIAPGRNLTFDIGIANPSGACYILTQGNYGLRVYNNTFTNFVYGKRFRVTSPSIVVNTIYNVQGGDNFLIANGVNGTQESDSDSPSGNVILFSQERQESTGKLYYCKLYDNDVLVRNLIPCYRKSDNVIGMYDTINGVFYTNSGSGTFLKGNNKNFII